MNHCNTNYKYNFIFITNFQSKKFRNYEVLTIYKCIFHFGMYWNQMCTLFCTHSFIFHRTDILVLRNRIYKLRWKFINMSMTVLRNEKNPLYSKYLECYFNFWFKCLQFCNLNVLLKTFTFWKKQKFKELTL